MASPDLLNWFKEELLPTLVKSGKFSEVGETESLEKCEFEAIETGVSNFASVPTFAKLIVNAPTGPKTHEIIIKFQCQDPVFREKMKLIPLFQNEVNTFTQVLPAFVDFLKHCGGNESFVGEIAPKCYFAMHEEPDKSIVVLEDLKKYGYRLSTSLTDLNLDHCLLAFERLAQFHAVSFAMKFRKWNTFEKLKNSFEEVWLIDNEKTRNEFEEFFGYCSTRGINYLMSQTNSEVPFSYLEKLRTMLQPASLFDLLKNLYSPKEPLSVICHGDFNRNNTMYRYNDGTVVDAKLVDFQRAFYGSPCLDLSFFIYMNTTLEFREKYFDTIFKHYHSNLIKSIGVILKESEESVADRLPIRAFMEEFGRVAITGYVTVSFFLPIMMAPMETDFEDAVKEKSPKEMALDNYAQGGETASQRIADVIVDFYRRKFYV